MPWKKHIGLEEENESSEELKNLQQTDEEKGKVNL